MFRHRRDVSKSSLQIADASSPLSSRELCPKATLRDMIAVVHSSSRNYISVEGTRLLLDHYFGMVPYEFPADQEHLAKLCRLHTRLSYFKDELHRYMAQRTALRGSDLSTELTPFYVAGHGEQNCDEDDRSQQPSPSLFTPFSWSENARLDRAFLRFELYCHSFPPDGTKMMHCLDLTTKVQFHLFIERLMLLGSRRALLHSSFLHVTCGTVRS